MMMVILVLPVLVRQLKILVNLKTEVHQIVETERNTVYM